MAKKGRNRQKLVVVSLGLTELQQKRMEVLMRVTHKSRSRLLREAFDQYFETFKIGDETLGDAENRLYGRSGPAAENSDRRAPGSDIPGQLSLGNERPPEV